MTACPENDVPQAMTRRGPRMAGRRPGLALALAFGAAGALAGAPGATATTTDLGEGASVDHPPPDRTTRLTPEGSGSSWRYYFPVMISPPGGCIDWQLSLTGRTLVAVDPRDPTFRRQVYFSPRSTFSQGTPAGRVKVYLNSFVSTTRVPKLPPGVKPDDVAEIRISGYCKPPGVTPTQSIDQAVRIPISLTRGTEYGSGAPSPSPSPSGGGPARITLSAAQLLINQRIGQAAIRRLNQVQAALDGRAAPPARRSGTGRVTLSARQLLINQRIYQAGVRRAAALEARLDGLPAPSAAPTSGGRVRLSAAQLRINQRIAQAAVRRANRLVERVASGG